MRTPTLLAVGMAGLWLGAGCSNPMGVIPPPSDRNFVLVDQFPAWTPDGAALYFHRGFASSLGPPGLYRTTWAGDTTTPVGVGDRTGPIKLRVSPDGSRIGALWYSGLISIDPLRRTFQTLYRTDNGEDSFDWDPAGNRVVVSRPLLAPGEDPDSSGLAILDLATGSVATLKVNHQPTFGTDVRWSPNGEWIAYQYARGIYVVRPDGTERIQLTFPDRDHHAMSPRWLDRGDALLFVEQDERSMSWRNRSVRISDRRLSDWPVRLGDADAITPDGQQVVISASDPSEKAFDRLLFFLVGIDDRWGTSRRQLTFYAPPVGGTLSRAGITPAPAP